MFVKVNVVGTTPACGAVELDANDELCPPLDVGYTVEIPEDEEIVLGRLVPYHKVETEPRPGRGENVHREAISGILLKRVEYTQGGQKKEGHFTGTRRHGDPKAVRLLDHLQENLAEKLLFLPKNPENARLRPLRFRNQRLANLSRADYVAVQSRDKETREEIFESMDIGDLDALT